MRNSRITFISQFCPSPSSARQTGGTISNRNLLRTLGREYDVMVLSFDTSSNSHEFGDEPYEVVHRPAPEWSGPQLLKNWLGFVKAEVFSHLSNTQSPAAVIATTSTLAAFDVTPKHSRRVAIVRAYENFGLKCPWVPLKQRVALGKLAAIRRFQDPRLMRQADAILTNSKFMRTAIAERFSIASDRIFVLPQLCDVEEPPTRPPPNSVGFVHRGAVKGLAFVLRLARRSPELQYFVYGHENGLSSDLPSNVSFCGWATDRTEMFASAAVWLVPSVWAEPFGRVSIEAQAANRAVLVAANGGLPETVFDPRFRIDGFDADSWLDRIRMLLGLGEQVLAKNGAAIRDAFSARRHDERIADVLAQIIAS